MLFRPLLRIFGHSFSKKFHKLLNLAFDRNSATFSNLHSFSDFRALCATKEIIIMTYVLSGIHLRSDEPNSKNPGSQ